MVSDWDIQILKAKWDFWCEDSRNATHSREHCIPDTYLRLKYGLSGGKKKNRGSSLMDLLLVNKLPGVVKVEGSFRCDGHEIA